MNKKERRAAAFAAAGIEYNPKTDRIYFPGLDIWTKPLLIDGNRKIGKGVFHFSTLAGTRIYENLNVATAGRGRLDWNNPRVIDIAGTCLCECEKGYCLKGCYTFPSTRAALGLRTYIARENPDYMVRAIIAQIESDKIRFVRIHATGDFFGGEYLAAWKSIISATPTVNYWSYTKNPAAESYFDDLPNMNMVKSRLPSGAFNFGTCGEILSRYDGLKAAGDSVYVCRCGIDKNQHCTNCKGCTLNKFVLFLLHGDPAYDSSKDPLLPKLRDLIESQDPAIAKAIA